MVEGANAQDPDKGLVAQEPVDLILDSVIGYSFRSVPPGLAAQVSEWANSHPSEAQILSYEGVEGISYSSPFDHRYPVPLQAKA